jgi:hypothetical protein
MIIQQRMSSASMQQQKGMMYLMSVFMSYIFMKFAAGLNLYWMVYNLLTMGHQELIKKKLEAEEPGEPAEGHYRGPGHSAGLSPWPSSGCPARGAPGWWRIWQRCPEEGFPVCAGHFLQCLVRGRPLHWVGLRTGATPGKRWWN